MTDFELNRIVHIINLILLKKLKFKDIPPVPVLSADRQILPPLFFSHPEAVQRKAGCFFIAFRVSKPSMTGIRRSIKTTSGLQGFDKTLSLSLFLQLISNPCIMNHSYIFRRAIASEKIP